MPIRLEETYRQNPVTLGVRYWSIAQVFSALGDAWRIDQSWRIFLDSRQGGRQKGVGAVPCGHRNYPTLADWSGGALLLWAAAYSSLGFAETNIQLGLPATSVGESIGPEVDLGRKIFFDQRLSADGTISCASCHRPEVAFSDGRALPKGVLGKMGSRNTPSLANVAFLDSLFWDGRKPSLEAQAREPFFNPIEHGLPDEAVLLGKFRRDRAYRVAFRRAYGVDARAITLEHVVLAIAAFERTLIFGDSAFDRYQYGGEENALSESGRRGLLLFRGKAQCASCHLIGPDYALFTDHQFHSLGIGLTRIDGRLAELTARVLRARPEELDALILGDPDVAELGRFNVTHKPGDIGRFRTPSLRNVAVTAPYMHDGSVATLEEAVALELAYRRGTHPILLTPQERTDIVEFLRSLTSREFVASE